MAVPTSSDPEVCCRSRRRCRRPRCSPTPRGRWGRRAQCNFADGSDLRVAGTTMAVNINGNVVPDARLVVAPVARQRQHHAAQHPHRRAAGRADPAAGRVLRRPGHRSSRRRPDRAGPPAPDRDDRGRVARAAHPTVGDRGADVAGARARARRRLVSQRFRVRRRGEQADAPPRRRPALAGPIRQHRGGADVRGDRPRRPRGRGVDPLRGRGAGARSDAQPWWSSRSPP